MTSHKLKPFQRPESSREDIWYRGEHCNFLPDKKTILDNIEAIENNILYGLVPPKPFITKSYGITAFGSCFATGIFVRLKEWGYNIDPLNTFLDRPYHTHVTYHQSSMVNSYTVLQQFEWAYENKNFQDDIWQDKPGCTASNDEQIRRDTKLLFDNTDVFIITFGLSEIWCNVETNEVFWRAVPKKTFDPKKHSFRVCTYNESYSNIKKLIKTIRSHRPNSTIVLTLSPIKLYATFRPIGCIPANNISKAILISALDQVLRESKDVNLFYWPSYEIVVDGFSDPWIEDNRHPRSEVQEVIMQLFKKYYLVNE